MLARRLSRRVLREERGSVVVATMTLVLMLVLALATYSVVQSQTQLSSTHRVRESSFNMAEGVLNAQAFIIGRLGPGGTQAGRQYPAECPSTEKPEYCPDPAAIAASFDGQLQADYAGGQTAWTTSVRDNGSGSFYDPAVVESQPAGDANGDKQVWVRAHATVRGQERTLVALVEVEERHVDFPRYALTAGHFSTTNNGNKVIVDSSSSLGIAVRCSEPARSSCLDYAPNKGQVSPPGNVTLDYANQTAISADDLAGLEELARANGTYYTGCPTNPNGAVVIVESGNCTYDDSAPGVGNAKCCNTADAPGIFIVKNGTFHLGGNLGFHGIAYALNQQASTGDVVSLGGTAVIRGGVMVDGAGGISAGASGANIIFDPRPFDGAKSFGTAGIVQNTWREVIG